MYYTYSIKNVQTGKFYIGSRTAKCMLNRKPEDDLGVKYFSSSKDKELRQAIKEGCVEYHVLQEYDDAKVCYLAEQKLIALYWKFFGREMSYNHHYSTYNGNNVFSNAGKHLSEETKKKIGEAHKGKPGTNKGKHLSEETKKKLSEAKKNKYVGKKWYNNGIEEIILYPEDTEKYIKNGYVEGRLKSVMRKVADKHIGNKAWNKGKKGLYITSEETKKLISKKMTGRKFSDETLKKMSGWQKGKPKPKFYWQTPSGEIRIMGKLHATMHHPDWVLTGSVE